MECRHRQLGIERKRGTSSMSKLKIHTSSKWYKDGIKFECTGCGKCCTGSPGYVWLRDSEIEKIAEHLQISIKEFLRKYTRLVNGKVSLLEDKKSFDCVFLKDQKFCTIYNVRPKQCKTYPFWDEVFSSEDAWMEESTRCEGINKSDGTSFSEDEIQERLEDNRK